MHFSTKVTLFKDVKGGIPRIWEKNWFAKDVLLYGVYSSVNIVNKDDS